MVLLPKEHGAYGQLALPIVTALSATAVSTPGLFLTASAVAGFLAHEPASILLGLRGSRVKRELRKTARSGPWSYEAHRRIFDACTGAKTEHRR